MADLDDKISVFVESVLPNLTREEIDRLLEAIEKRLDELETPDSSARALRLAIRNARKRCKDGLPVNSIAAGIVAGMKQGRGHE